MAYRLVKGEFHLFYQGQRKVGSQPDGDSVWFKPSRTALLRNLNGRDAKYNGGGFVQLRFEAIDTVELHYEGSHQELQAATAARDFTLRELGFRRVTYSGAQQTTVAAAAPHPRSGYILTRGIDPFGRPVSFVYPGSAPRPDGSSMFVTPATLRGSVNLRLAESGHAFSTFYTGLPTDLRQAVIVAARRARQRRRGLWPRDRSLRGATVARLSQLEALVVWPKLFRRLASYFNDGNRGLQRLDSWLRAQPDRDDALWIVPRGELGNLHDVLQLSGNRIRMRFAPDELIIVPR